MVNNASTSPAMKEIFEIAKSISSLLDVDALLKKIGGIAERLLAAEASSIMLLDDDQKSLFFKMATGEKGGAVQKMKVPLGQGIAGIAAQERKTIIVNDAAHDPRYDGQLDKLTGFVTRAAMCAPMIADQELVGVMEVLNKKSGQGFTRDDADILESLAALCAVSIANARVSEDHRNFFVNIIELVVTAIESRDARLAGHSWNVAQRATTIAKHLGMQGQEYKNLYYGALLHDIGLIGVREQLSLSQGVMTVRDRDAETSHPRVGADLVKNINLLKGAVPVIRHHHENFDGTGYPDSLAGEAIPLGARIVAVAEAIEEMRLGGLADDRIRQFVKLGQETRFDPQIVGIFLKETL